MTETKWILQRIANNEDQSYTILPGETTVGRGESNLIQCSSLMVSRRQCVFILKPCGNVYLRDLGSSNGTFINVEKSLTNRDVPLMEDDIIGLGVDDVNINTDDNAYFFKLCKILVQVNEKQERRGASSFSSATVPKEEIINVNPQEGTPLETINSTITGSKRQATTNLSECPSKILKLSNDLSLQKMGEETDVPSVNNKNLTSEHLDIKNCDVPTKITDEIDVIMISDSDDGFDDIRVLKDVNVSDKEFQSIQDSNKSNDNHLVINKKVVVSDDKINKRTDTFESRMNGEMCLGDYNSTPSSSKYNLSKDCITISTDNTNKVYTSVSTSIEKLKFPMQNNMNNTCDILNTYVNEEHKLLPEKYNGNAELLGSVKNVSTFQSDNAVPDSLRNGECKKDSESNTEQNSKKYSNRSKEENLKKKSNTVVENTINENIVSKKTESNLIKIMPENTNSNKDLDINLLQTAKESFGKSIELENNDCEVVKKEEESTPQNTTYTLGEHIILIDSDDEMPHSQMFDDPDILSEEKDKDKEMIDDRMSDDDEYNMVMDVGDLDDNDESEEDEWFQKLSQQFIDKEDERQGSRICKERSLEEEDMDSSPEKVDSELDKDSGVGSNKEEDYTCTKTNDVAETVKSYDEMNKDRAFDLNKDEDSGKSKFYEKHEDLLSNHRKRKMSNKKNNLQVTTIEVAETKEEENFVKTTTTDISDTSEKEDSVKVTTMEVTESKEDDKDSIQGTVGNREVIKPEEAFNTKSRTCDDNSYSDDVKQKVKSKMYLKKRFSHVKHKKDIEVENKSKTKNEMELLQTTSNTFVDNDEDDPIKYAAKLLEHLADSERKKGPSVSNSVSEVNQIQEDIKKLSVPYKKTMSIDALPQKPSRTSKVNQKTLSTKPSHKSIKNTNSNKKTLNPIKGSNKLDLPSDSLSKKNVVEMRKMKLKELTEKKKPSVSHETKTPKPSISKNVKLTIKNRSALLVDAFVNEQKYVNHKSPNILTDYKIPRRTSTEQRDDYKKVEQDPKVTIFEPSLDIVTQSNSTLEPSFKKPPRRKSSAEQNEKFQVQKTKNDLNEKFPGNTTDKLKPKSFNNNCVRPILINYSNNVIIQKQCCDNGKKRVQFENDKNLVRTRFIPFLENSMRRPVKKDAPPPPNVVRKLQQQTNSSQNSFDYSDETMYDICKWNSLWFEEQKRHPANQPPPVCPGPLFGCKEEYTTYQDYRRTMYPLLLRELWANVTKAWDQRRKVVYNIAIDHDSYRTPQEFKVKSPTVTPEEQTKTLVHINCQTLLDSEDFRKNIYPRFGDLVVAEVYVTIGNNEEPKHFGLTLLGYICKATPNKITQYMTHVRPELLSKYPDAKTLLDMVLLVRGPISILDHKRLGRIRILKSIRADLRVFRALDKLQESPLLPQILNPNFNRFTQNDPMDLPELVSYENAPVLNEAQRRAVLTTAKLCLEDSDKERIHLIHGPPGTGKSQVIISLVMQLWMNLYQKSKEQPRILLCAPSNAAIDELVLRLMEIRTKLSGRKKFRLLRNGRIESTHASVQCLTLDTLRERDVKKSIEMLEDVDYHKVEIDNLTAKINSLSLSLDSIKESRNVYSPEEKRIKEEIIEKKLTEAVRRKNEFINQIENKKIDHNTIKKMHADAETKLLECANIVASTLASCYNTQMEKAFNTVIDNKRFTCCIIDEATQATEPDILIPLLLRVNNVVLVGDPKQLQATVIDTVAKDYGLNKSLFTRHRMWWYRKEHTWESKNMLLHFLDKQYRMHPAIAQWPSDYFYNKFLKTDESVEPLRKSPFLPYVILTHDHQQDKEGELNIGETLIIQNIVWTIRNTDKSKDYSIGIITPYNRQRFSLANIFSGLTNTQVEVGTVDSFQGREKDIIIFSCVRTDGVGFLNDVQRLNVALTRAKMSLIICGNFKSLQHDITWSLLLMNATIRNAIKPVPSSMCLYTRNPNFFDLIKR